jgi:hypothetical protein
LNIILQILHYANKDVLEVLLKDVAVSSFIANIFHIAITNIRCRLSQSEQQQQKQQQSFVNPLRSSSSTLAATATTGGSSLETYGEDLNVAGIGVLMCELLMGKLPAIFQSYFRREGVLHEILHLEKVANALQTSTQSQQRSASSTNNNSSDNNGGSSDLVEWIIDHTKQFKATYFTGSQVH